MDFWTQYVKTSTSGQHELWSIYVFQRGGLGKSPEGRGRILVLSLNLTSLASPEFRQFIALTVRSHVCHLAAFD